MTGEAAHADFVADGALAPLGPCTLSGRLIDLGDWPGLIDGPGEVAAELYAIVDAEILARLDAFEDYEPADPEGSLYLRERVALVAPAGEAFAYRYVGPRAGRAVIAGGDWRAWRGKRAA